MAISPLRTCISREHKCTYSCTCKSIPHNSLTDGCHYTVWKGLIFLFKYINSFMKYVGKISSLSLFYYVRLRRMSLSEGRDCLKSGNWKCDHSKYIHLGLDFLFVLFWIIVVLAVTNRSHPSFNSFQQMFPTMLPHHLSLRFWLALAWLMGITKSTFWLGWWLLFRFFSEVLILLHTQICSPEVANWKSPNSNMF